MTAPRRPTADDRNARAYIPIWDREPPRPRKSPGLTRERIVAAAIDLADTSGLDGLTIRDVADRLGSSPMTLYRHIPSKEDLIDLMLDTLIAEQDLDGLPTGDWVHDLTQIGHQQRALRLRHPWSLLPATRPPIGPHALRRMETALTAFPDHVPVERRAWAITVIDAYVYGDTSAELAERYERARTGLDKDQWQQAVAPYLTKALTAGDMPLLATYIAADPASRREQDFEDGLHAVIAGIQAKLAD